jgi:hypothetical protein
MPLLIPLIPGVGMGGGGNIPVGSEAPGMVLRAGKRTLFSLRAMKRTGWVCRARRDVEKHLRASMMSISSNLSFFRGEDITLDFHMQPPEDITGWTISFEMAAGLASAGSPAVTKAASIVDGPRGIFRVALASADTSGLTVGRYIWDCRRTDAGNKATLADGYLDLKQELAS